MLLLLSLLTMLDRSPKTLPRQQEKCSIIELNHRFDDAGRHCYDQYIFWEWHPSLGRHVALGFALESDKLRLKRLGNACDLEWIVSTEKGYVTRNIKAPVFRETWTDYDPERQDKDTYPESKRRKMWE